MKKYSQALLVLAAILGLLYYLYDESERNLRTTKSAFSAVLSEVETLKGSREATSNQIVELNRSVRESAEFLRKWTEHYGATKEFYENTLTSVADKTGCAVIERKWSPDPVTLQMGKVDFETVQFKGTVVGDYRKIVKFIGELETQLQLSVIWKMEFRVGVNGVACAIELYLPRFSLEGVMQ